MANSILCPVVTDILSRSEITDTLLILPDEQLERKLYEKVAKAIKLAGGKWKTHKKGFLFDKDPRQKLGLALETGVVIDEKKLNQAFYTPQEIAESVAIDADVNGKRVLEPSAGVGALAYACLDAGAEHIDAYEINPECISDLSGTDITTIICDFLEEEPEDEGNLYERIVMNPPFSKGQDAKHIIHAMKWLSDGGHLYAIVLDQEHPKLDHLEYERMDTFPSGAFKESGTMVATQLIRIIK